MKKRLFNRAILYYLIVLPAGLVFIFVFHNPNLFAIETTSTFQFNPHSEYWPTKGWKYSTPEKQGMSSKKLIKVFEEFKNRNLNIKSVLVVRNGYIVVEANRYRSETLHPIYSSTKSVVSAIIGIALDKGHIKDINQTLPKYFPKLWLKYRDKKKASITLKHLLTMSCGFEWPELQISYLNSENPARQMMQSLNTVQYILNKPVKQQPGQNFNYNSGCSHLLLAVLEQTGLDVVEFAHESLFKPMGIPKSQYVWSHDSHGIPNGGYGLSMRPSDMAKFGYLYLKGGNWNGKQIIPRTWVDTSSKKQIAMNWGGFIADHYGYKWYIHPFGFHSLGFMGQYIFVIPKQELVVVFTSGPPRSRSHVEMPINLVKSYIVPAVKASQALPEDEKAITILKTKIKEF